MASGILAGLTKFRAAPLFWTLSDRFIRFQVGACLSFVYALSMHLFRVHAMIRSILVISCCLLFSITVNGDEARVKARELAETRLLAEWVGVPEEQYTLGNAYYMGDGVPRDYAEAAKWFQLSADQGLAESRFMLGMLNERGYGMPPDFLEAIKWYRQSADQGYLPAQFELGNMYALGKGVPQNYTEAYLWYSIAAASGHEDSRKERDKFAGKLSREEIMQAQARAKKMFETIQQNKTPE